VLGLRLRYSSALLTQWHPKPTQSLTGSCDYLASHLHRRYSQTYKTRQLNVVLWIGFHQIWWWFSSFYWQMTTSGLCAKFSFFLLQARPETCLSVNKTGLASENKNFASKVKRWVNILCVCVKTAEQLEHFKLVLRSAAVCIILDGSLYATFASPLYANDIVSNDVIRRRTWPIAGNDERSFLHVWIWPTVPSEV